MKNPSNKGRVALVVVILVSLNVSEAVDMYRVKGRARYADKPSVNELELSHGAINAEARDEFYRDVGLDGFVRDFDDVEKDVLYLRLRKLSAKKVSELYPKAPPEAILRASGLVGPK